LDFGSFTTRLREVTVHDFFFFACLFFKSTMNYEFAATLFLVNVLPKHPKRIAMVVGLPLLEMIHDDMNAADLLFPTQVP
jgi:hypothetical protein